ncbi:hypothetical protein KC887_03105 [Candidatus Kaiserbacteria bacterium]|nr:hypothetical protein [Candidatus Kaiserbacteria bacterium]
MKQRTKRHERPCKLYRCTEFTSSRHLFAFWWKGVHFRGLIRQGSYDTMHGVYEVIGDVTDPLPFAQQLVVIDLINDSDSGFFTFLSGMELRTLSVCALICAKNATRSVFGVIANNTAERLVLSSRDGLIDLRRNQDDSWGPHIYRGTVPNFGLTTIYL